MIASTCFLKRRKLFRVTETDSENVNGAVENIDDKAPWSAELNRWQVCSMVKAQDHSQVCDTMIDSVERYKQEWEKKKVKRG